MKNDHRSKLERRSLKKDQGFNGIRTRDLRDTGAMLYQLSYEATHWERGQLIEFISSYLPVRSEMMWSIYEIIHIRTAVVNESEEYQLSYELFHIYFTLNKVLLLCFSFLSSEVEQQSEH